LKKLRIYLINQFGFSRTEANGVIILIFVMFATAIIPRLFFRYQLNSLPKKDFEIKAWQLKFKDSLVQKEVEIEEQNAKPAHFKFNPNLSSYEELISLGFSIKETKQIIAFRNAGGTFKIKSDLAKIYSINHSLLVELSEFIDLPESKIKTSPAILTENDVPAVVIEVAKIDINTANAEELQKIKGVGKVISERTIKYRDALGGFYDFNQLKEVYYLHDSLVPYFENQFFIDTTQLKKIQLTEENLELLKQHPYLNYNQAKAIINYQKVNGITKEKDLQKIKILPDSTIRKLSYYIKF
jgi:competence protein ComEA